MQTKRHTMKKTTYIQIEIRFTRDYFLGCHELPKSPRITEITKKLTEITTKRTEITDTSCRYILTGFKNVYFVKEF